MRGHGNPTTSFHHYEGCFLGSLVTFSKKQAQRRFLMEFLPNMISICAPGQSDRLNHYETDSHAFVDHAG
jgi:hypothetical protein